jgi:lipopolysaccharide/colanic/teichoic acid biosynthesis glycosyltransferase/glycosyltransferase involved in cell wall biosynthesis
MKVSLLHITTVPMSLTFLKGQVRFMEERGYRFHALCSPGPELDDFGRTYGVPVFGVEMPRQITPLRDLAAVGRIWRVIRRVRPRIVHAHTPKGGLLGMIAAALAGVPVRIYHMRGLPLVAATGPRRQLMRWTEVVACRLASRVFCVSPSLREVALAEALCAPEKITVLASGSGQGVDAEVRFHPERLGTHGRERTRQRLLIPTAATVVGFVGRLVRDKGIVDLAEAWRSLRSEYPAVHLLLVGPLEPQDPIPPEVIAGLRTDERVHMVGMDWNTPPLLAAMDLLVLPTYREGFPNVPLEAAAMRLPVVATRIAGCVDAVEDGVTGTLVAPRDARALGAAIRRYLEDPELRARHGDAGRERVLRLFRPERIREAIHAEYAALLRERGPGRVGRVRPTGRRAPAKRLFDVAVSALALIVLSPVLLATALAVRISLGPPVLFRQQRPGLHGRPFTILKFRTLGNARDADGNPLPDAQRMTRFGRWLRSTSLDELPELWNVLRGDMSLVGPRPLLMQYMELYDAEQARRHHVRPGIAGWAQVNGRNALSWDDKFRMDVWYVDHRTFWLDLRILLRTLRVVLLREGISQQGHATAEVFRGNRVAAEARECN